MAKFQFNGLNEYVSRLSRIRDATPAIKHAVYVGAGVVADEIRTEIEKLPIEKDTFYQPENYMSAGVTSLQKEGLLDGLGVAGMWAEDGGIYTKIGFEGYNEVLTRKYPHGQPNALIARAVISGTSFRKKNNFVGRAVKAVKAEAENQMRAAFDEIFDKMAVDKP